MANNSSQNRSLNLKEAIKQEQKERAVEYRRQLKDMQRRLEEKMCLFEQIEIENAKRRTLKDIEKIVKKM
jgi:TolA-binding protein